MTALSDDINEKMGAHFSRYFCDVCLCIQLIVYIFALWLTASTGQPLERVMNLELHKREDIHRSFKDVVNLLELETQPYVILQNAKRHTNYINVLKVDKDAFQFDLDFFVKFISRTFRLDFLNETVLVN